MTANNSPPYQIVLRILSLIANILLLITIITLCLLIVVRRENNIRGVTDLHIEVGVAKTIEEISKDTTKTKELERLQRDLAHYYGAKKPACHLEPALHAVTGTGVQTLYWASSSENTVLEDGLNLVNGIVVVKTEGYYFIYSQIAYRGNGTEELDYGRIIHRVEKRKSGEGRSPSPLLQNFQSTPSIRRGREVFSTSRLEGTFFLEEGSIVSVLSSVPRNIDFSPLRTYYGLFLM